MVVETRLFTLKCEVLYPVQRTPTETKEIKRYHARVNKTLSVINEDNRSLQAGHRSRRSIRLDKGELKYNANVCCYMRSCHFDAEIWRVCSKTQSVRRDLCISICLYLTMQSETHISSQTAHILLHNTVEGLCGANCDPKLHRRRRGRDLHSG